MAKTPDLGGWLEIIAERLGLSFCPRERDALIRYTALLREWNAWFNLTTLTSDEDIAVRHFEDSLTVLPLLRQEQARAGARLRLIDVGTGAGLPGVVLKIMEPELELVLLDALAKRVTFLDEVIAELRLTQTQALHARAEDAGRDPAWRDQFDLVTARVVAPLPVLAEYCLPFARPGGLFWALKGQADGEWPAAERAVSLLAAQLETSVSLVLPGTDFHRTLFQFRKLAPTPKAWPRKAGKPEKQPL